MASPETEIPETPVPGALVPSIGGCEGDGTGIPLSGGMTWTGSGGIVVLPGILT
jgi:hypothetical protein